MHYILYLLLAMTTLAVVGYKLWLRYQVTHRTKRGTEALKGADFATAERQFRLALREAEHTRRSRSDSLVLALINLALLEERRQKREAAIHYAAKAIHAMNGALDESGNFRLAYEIIARLLESNGEFAEAVRFRKDALAAQQAFTQQESPELALACFQLGRTLRLAEKPNEAAAAFEQCIRVWGMYQPAHAVNLGAGEMELAMALTRSGKATEAERRYRSAIKVLTASEGPDGSSVALAWSGLGGLYAGQERPEQAMEAYSHALRIGREKLGDQHPSVARISNSCADSLRRLGKLEEAELMAKGAAAVLREAGDAGLAEVLDTLGWICLDGARYEEAAALFEEAYVCLQANPVRSPQNLHDFAERRAEALVRLGRFAEAGECRARWILDTASAGLRLGPLAQDLLDARPQRPPGAPLAKPEQLIGETPQMGLALLALTVTFGAYLLAIVSAVGLGWLTSVFFSAGAYLPALTCVALLYAIVSCILPRKERVGAPGPELKAAEHKGLFEVIQSVAQATGQPAPLKVYLAPQLNAFLSVRGGLLGFGARRVMGLGLPLLQMLTVDELRSLIAHEFGHFAPGEARLSGRIYRTRNAMIRSLNALFEANSILRFPFRWYSAWFLKMTLRAARRQEFAADRLAARITSPAVAASALRLLHSNLYTRFWSREMQTVLKCGYLPPISAGFDIFRRERADLSSLEPEEDADGKDPYETHPPLETRLQALAALQEEAASPPDKRPAVELLCGLREMELRVALAAGDHPEGGWNPIEWGDCPLKVHYPAWKEEQMRFESLFHGLRVRDVPLLAPDHVQSRVHAEFPDEPEDWRKEHALDLVARAIALALVRDGWLGLGSPGEPVWFEKGSRRTNPSGDVRKLWSGEINSATWRERALQTGVSHLWLSAVDEPSSERHPPPRAAMTFTLVQRRSSF